jgi:S1-C subfamily serine protease
MRTVVVAVVSALIGGGAAAGVVLALGDDEAGGGRTVVEQAPLGRAGGGEEDDGLTPAEIYRRDAPGVVFITAEVVQESASPFDVFPQEQRGRSTGTGFVIDRRGSILTNAHVVANAEDVEVRFSDGRSAPARVRGRDASTDVALLEVERDGLRLRPLALGTSGEVEVGDPTVAIGNPFGLDLTLTTGVISAKQRRIEAPNGFQIDDVLQTDAAINPGNSGGPLIDAAGRVIGINSAIRTGTGGGSVGIGFAVPIDTARRILPQLREKGRVDRAYLGVTTATVTPDLDLGADRGAFVEDVVPGGPADDAGLRPTDIIVGVDGRAVRASEDVGAAIDRRAPGDTVAVDVVRAGERETVEVDLERRPDTVGS